jgi:hypothetical protein
MPKIHAPLFLLLLLPVASVRAQVRASITESRVITEKPGEAPDTVVMRTVAAGPRARMEVSGPGAMHLPWSMIGSTTIMVSSDSSITTTHIDPLKKVYWIDDTGKTIANNLKWMHLDVQPETAPDTARLDSLGSGGMIDGYNTIHFRERSATRMSVSTASINSVTTQTTIYDYYVAPGLKSDSIDKTVSPGIRLPSRDMVTLSLAMKELGAREAANKKRMAKIGDIVRTVAHSTVDADNLFHTQNTTTTERILDTVAVVPDSLFVVPASYTRTTPTPTASLRSVPVVP